MKPLLRTRRRTATGEAPAKPTHTEAEPSAPSIDSSASTHSDATVPPSADSPTTTHSDDAASTSADSSTTTHSDTSVPPSAARGKPGARPRQALVNGRLLPANWRTEQPPKTGVTERFSTWAARYPVVGEVAGELRSGEVGRVFWQRPKACSAALWSRRPTSEQLRHVLIERRVLIAAVAAVALFAAADAHLDDALTQYPPRPGEAQRVAIAYPPQVPPNPQSAARMLAAIAKGEKRREAGVVAAATLATLERAKAEAAAAASGEWQPWMGERAPVVPGVLVPGSTPSTGGFSLPAKGAFTSGFGSRWGTMHRGIDIAAPIGSPIYAVADGTVIEAGPAQGFGLWVRIKHDDGTISIYGHMYDFIVSPGERVPAGMQIARIGNRGDSTGPHLHFEIVQNGQHVDPQAWLALHGLSLT